MPIKKSYLSVLFWLFFAGLSASAVALGGLYLFLSPKLPPVDTLRHVKLQTPLRVYSSDDQLIGEFGEQRRTPVRYEDIPELYIQALLSAEDAEFYDHRGISIRGFLRAASLIVQTGEIQGGGSTITMQLARDFFLTREQVFSRKLNEVLLALQIERELSKEEILELFNNKMFFGNRAYGIQAAAQIYYGRNLDELELHQMAMIVGVLKAPSAYNPLANPSRALTRRNWILGRMFALNYIDEPTYIAAVETPDDARYHGATLDLYAPYVAELARREAVERFGTDAYTDGYKVYTTVNSRHQAAAQAAVVEGLLTYDRRHGYRGPEARLEELETEGDYSPWLRTLRSAPRFGGLSVGAVLAVEEQSAEVLLANGETITLEWDQGLSRARRYINENARGPAPQSASDVLAVRDMIRLQQVEDQWHLSQVPTVQGALVSVDPQDGAMRAVVGGFDFRHSQLNRALQSVRQPGSSFKPFVYTAALENGFTPSSIVNDSPVVIQDASLEGAWRPENDGGTFLGPTRLREALYRSRNLVSIRVLRSIGLPALLDTLDRFGFAQEELPRNLSISLGSHAVTPLELATAYAIFANGGYRVESYVVSRIEDSFGQVLHRARPLTVCKPCEQEDRDSADDFSRQQLMATASHDLAEPLELESTQPVSAPDEPVRLATLEESLGTRDAPDQVILEPLPIAPRVIDERTAYLMDSMMRDVITRGTGHRARALGRNDLAGKTGTTNGPRDAWFAGYSPDLSTVAWLGFDQNTPLGRGEYGGTAAQPIWINYMRVALEGLPDRPPQQPDGIVTVRINPENGRRAHIGDPNAIFEMFTAENVPPREDRPSGTSRTREEQSLPEELF
ncbi:penicillin-binding protein 1A [Marinimicrobium sp. ABcell2]|nr:penicillin-binding protein 1A [Marinimicrobium sp. ABcell2]MDQ2076517.1 penicillin-binding protein 1A [Marinimicrobium sp. ABcell2]